MSANPIRHFRDLEAYQLAFEFQQLVFDVSRKWPREETYALTDQVRRSSRSIGANLAEAWAKRRYPAHFLAKLTDSDGELQESSHWISTAGECRYLTREHSDQLLGLCDSVGRKLGGLMIKYEKFCI